MTDRRPAGMAGDGDAAELLDVGDELLGVEAHVGEVEALEHGVVDAVDEHVAVVGLDLRSLEDADAVLVLEVAVVAVGVELAVLGQHQTVDRQHVLLLEQPLQVADHGGAAVFGLLRVCV